jgi:hypothetical protein
VIIVVVAMGTSLVADAEVTAVAALVQVRTVVMIAIADITEIERAIWRKAAAKWKEVVKVDLRRENYLALVGKTLNELHLLSFQSLQ